MTKPALRDECGAIDTDQSAPHWPRRKALQRRPYDTGEAQVIVLKRAVERGDLLSPETLREHCLHPAEAWVLRRRANRPNQAPRRLPVVARVG